MDKKLKMTTDTGGEMNRCPVCESYYGKNDAFVCSKCRITFCPKHRVPGEKWCTSCVMEIKLKELDTMERHKSAVKSLSLLLQFLFILSAIIFVVSRLDFMEMLDMEYLSLFADVSVYTAVGTLIGYLICLGIMYNQKKGIQKTESLLKKIKRG